MMLSLMTSLLHGANIVHDVGFMDSGLQYSFQLAAIANDLPGFSACSHTWRAGG